MLLLYRKASARSCVQEHLQEVKRREEAAQAARAAQRKEADRVFTRLKAEKEAAMAAQEEQEFLINLLHQEENEAKARVAESDRKAHQARSARLHPVYLLATF
jgi:predicted transcriptional regulator